MQGNYTHKQPTAANSIFRRHKVPHTQKKKRQNVYDFFRRFSFHYALFEDPQYTLRNNSFLEKQIFTNSLKELIHTQLFKMAS